MAKDESSADAAATNAAPPEDDAPRGRKRAGSVSSPPGKRESTAATSHSRKSQSAKSLSTAAAPSPSAESISSSGSTEVAPPTAAAEAKPRAPRRSAATRGRAKKDPIAGIKAPVTVVAEPSDITEAQAAVVTDPKEPKRSSRGRRSAKKEQIAPVGSAIPSDTIVATTTAPVTEAVAPAVKAEQQKPALRGRRRQPTTRRPAISAAPTNETAATEQPAAIPVEAAAEPPPEALAPAKPSSRRRRSAPTPKVTDDDLKRGARLITRRGLVELHINGEPHAPVFFFGNVDGVKETRRVASEIKRAAANGVHLHSTLIEIPCPLPPDDTVYELLDSRIQTFLEADPKGYLMPRLVFVPAPGWMRQYPNEVTHYADGKTADPSIASDRFWTDAEHALAAIVEHLQRLTSGERIIGYHLERGEWFNPAENGYDRSFANRESFREWLRTKYKNSSVALRAAWFDGDVQFHTVEIPPDPPEVRPSLAFFEPRKQRRWIDFLEYTSDITASRLISLSKVVKSASENRALVSVCYGYTFEFEHTFSGHLALGKVLAAPTIDLIAGPPSYKDRQPGGAGSLPGPVDSMLVHGKLWISEDDTKTHLAPAGDSPDDYNPRLNGRPDTESVHQRAIGRALAHQSGIAWMDLWGEGWLDSDDLWENISTFGQRYGEFLKHRRTQSPEVVILLDERSVFHMQRGPNALKRLLVEQREMLARSGASCGFYLQSDVTARNFPTDGKLYIFLNPYRMPPEHRFSIRDKLHGGGKTLVWMYAVGVCDERGEPEESAHDVIGIGLRQQSWNSEVGSRVIETRHPITEKMSPREFGVREKLNPSFYVDDDEPGLKVLAEYQQSGLPSFALREYSDWNSVFCGEPTFTIELLRGLCRYAGVHLFTAMPDDYVSAGYGWLTTHSSRDGHRTLYLPKGASLYDFGESRLVADGAAEFKAFVKTRTTRSFYVGTPDEMRKLGFPGVEKSRTRRGRARGVPELTMPEAEPTEPTAPLNGHSEGELTEATPVPGEEQAVEENGGAPHKRRRRRRGGRGRGRRRASGVASTESAGENPPAAE